MASWRFAPQDTTGCWWYCDNCGALLNAQPGFTPAAQEWTCAACDEENDIREGNPNQD